MVARFHFDRIGRRFVLRSIHGFPMQLYQGSLAFAVALVTLCSLYIWCERRNTMVPPTKSRLSNMGHVFVAKLLWRQAETDVFQCFAAHRVTASSCPTKHSVEILVPRGVAREAGWQQICGGLLRYAARDLSQRPITLLASRSSTAGPQHCYCMARFYSFS